MKFAYRLIVSQAHQSWL